MVRAFDLEVPRHLVLAFVVGGILFNRVQQRQLSVEGSHNGELRALHGCGNRHMPALQRIEVAAVSPCWILLH